MTTNVLVTFYSTYGHVHRMALAVAEGAESVPEVPSRLIQTESDDSWLSCHSLSSFG
jgi:hypothetical protein